ncbi:hypothetical protein B0H19DRAFT_1079740 [Mycena capillaripes]|nr:hypothetical protein B0H19DRAFT_1079740 [Mycena capillaripes]
MASPVPSVSALSDKERHALDEANMALGITLSKRSYAESEATSSFSSSSLPIAGPSLAASSSSAMPAPSSSSTSVQQLHPVYPAGKTPSGSTQPSRRPKMTTQMSESWMRQYRDETAADAAAIKRDLYKTSLDLTLGRKLTLIFWGLISTRPVVLALQQLPDWPTWALSDSPHLMVRLGIEDEIVEHLDEKLKLWVEINVHYRHTLTADGHLFLRIPGAKCSQLAEIFSSVTAKPAHIRHNLPGDRSSIRRQKQVSNIHLIEIDSSDDDVPHKKKRKVAHASESDDDVEIIEETVIRSADDGEDDFPLSISIPTQSASTILRNALTIHHVVLSLPDRNLSLFLPGDINDLGRLDPSYPSCRFEPTLPGRLLCAGGGCGFQTLSIPDRFHHVFRRPYKKQTYSDALARWEKATSAQRERGLNAGRTPLGLWTNWQKAIPLKKSSRVD